MYEEKEKSEGKGTRHVDAMQEWAKEDNEKANFRSTSELDGTGTVSKMPSLLPDAAREVPGARAVSHDAADAANPGLNEMNGHLLHHGIHTWSFDIDKNNQVRSLTLSLHPPLSLSLSLFLLSGCLSRLTR